MSYNSTFRVAGDKHQLAVEWCGEAYTMTISLEKDHGKRTQMIRIPLSDFSYHDLNMWSSYISAFISSLDPEEMMMLDMDEDDPDQYIG